MAYRHRTAGRKIDFAPQSHILVLRHGIPIYEGYAQIGLRWREHFDRESVVATHFPGDIQLVRPPGACDLLGVGDLRPVQPDVRAIVDALKIEPAQSWFTLVWRLKRRTVP